MRALEHVSLRSRRMLLLMACAVLSVIIGSIEAAAAQQHNIQVQVRQTASSSLTLIRPTDDAFDSTLGSYFPGLAEEPAYQKAVRPFLVLVQNDTGLAAAAYAITWTAHYTTGRVRNLRAIFVNRRLMYKPAMTYLNINGIRLVSPLFNVTPDDYKANQYFTQRYSADRYPPSDNLSSVDVAVDGVVYADGSFIGPNSTHVYERFAAAQFAERDEALETLSFIKSSTAGPLLSQQLLQALNQEVRKDGLASQRTFLARYVRARGRAAQDLTRILSNRGASGLQAFLQTFVARSDGNLSPSMLDGMYQKLSDSDPRVFGILPWRGPSKTSSSQ